MSPVIDRIFMPQTWLIINLRVEKVQDMQLYLQQLEELNNITNKVDHLGDQVNKFYVKLLNWKLCTI